MRFTAESCTVATLIRLLEREFEATAEGEKLLRLGKDRTADLAERMAEEGAMIDEALRLLRTVVMILETRKPSVPPAPPKKVRKHRKPSAWNLFVGPLRREGLTMREIGERWREQRVAGLEPAGV